MDEPKKVNAILSLQPNANFVVDNGNVLWYSPDIPQPSEEEINTELARLQAKYNAQAYARNRKAEYPTTDELVVALWEAVIEERMASSIDLQGKRTAIKEKYPK